jgi:hypothetical protein
MGDYSWLPKLVLLSDYEGNWQTYENAIYEVFRMGFIDSKPAFRGRKLNLKKNPMEKGKEATFWASNK